MSLSLQFVRKVAVFEKVRREGMMPQPPLVGERWVVCSADFTRMVLLDRESLGVVARYDRPEWPLRWIGPERLLIAGARTVGVWDPAAERFVWRAERGGGGFPWRDRVVTWASDSELEIRCETGEVERTIDLGIRGVGWVMPCGDLLLHKTPESGDPVRAVHLADGRLQWTRNLLAEINQRRPAIGRDPAAPITPGSMPDRFIVKREGTMAGCSLTDGAILWTVEVMVPYHWPLIIDGRIPVLNNGRFTVTDEATGALLVDRRHPELSGMFREKQGSILGDLIVFTSESTHLAAFDLRTGDLVYVKHDERVGFWGTAVADGRLLAAGTDGNLWVYEAA
jgi:PQQ-like domain